jgi:beta-aspartyl-peptidase (threonine type)
VNQRWFEVIYVEFGVIVHGGAWDIPDEVVDDHLKGVSQACQTAYNILQVGGTAIDAAEQSVMYMENDSTFDAGRGSFVNQNAEVEMDAIIATENFQIGSVCAIQNVSNPIQVARLVRDRTDHIFLAGKGASQFAYKQGIKFVTPEELLVGRELERYYAIKKKKEFKAKDAFKPKSNGLGTVGAVCLDKKGRIAIGVSTGGTPFKKPGRVGDTPIWGAGGYVDTGGGAAATGYGEDIMRVLLTKRAIDYVHAGKTSQDAASQAISDLSEKVNGYGGVIVLTSDGIGLAFNTPRMAYSYHLASEKQHTGIENKKYMR